MFDLEFPLRTTSAILWRLSAIYWPRSSHALPLVLMRVVHRMLGPFIFLFLGFQSITFSLQHSTKFRPSVRVKHSWLQRSSTYSHLGWICLIEGLSAAFSTLKLNSHISLCGSGSLGPLLPQSAHSKLPASAHHAATQTMLWGFLLKSRVIYNVPETWLWKCKYSSKCKEPCTPPYSWTLITVWLSSSELACNFSFTWSWIKQQFWII